MSRFYVEYSTLTRSHIVHREHCITYPASSLGAIPRMRDIGEHEEDIRALEMAKMLYPDPSPCCCCFVRAYRESVISSCIALPRH